MKKISIIAVLLLALQMHGQQDPQYTQYMYNMNIINPAYAGSREGLSFGLLYRNQWTGIEGNPETGTFFGHTPLGNNLGVGLSLISDRIGPVTETNVFADISYTLKLGGEHRLAFGVKAGATFHDIGLTDLDVIDPSDPFFANDINTTTPNMGAGLFYYTNKYYVSLSVPNLLSSVHLDANGNKIGSETQHYFLTGGYVFDLSPNTELKPSVMIKSAFDAPTSFDVNLNARFFKKFEIGASYRLDDSFSGLVNFAISPAVRVGYAYDAISSDIKAFAPASHEVFLLFDLNFPKRVSRSPRYF
ncbi:type IX secretion system membrane protein PorP/SprF [Winogradskyella sp.]|uniref:PorP/SprF family type IX secretion system membrane protein n=1 Tax=uncultured Winogradskyella sp. TaxID=395353 RepID=UPI0023384B42|nr:type IX secretion system membrane protein PorP/SprF [Winogradskyella sp.]MDC0007203.1 type IX secretion system membrane protein PorP/SprF [Winogradskyella sp.]MDC0009008.1 type IX secretion system membrane protein PorP/SprF [Winogradskyella sp.]MDC1504765.1 type IX secretion system membrane protein PorP/SprF [Winogradskyella sp.]|tara:strand:+ start:240880 stop:241785 length:906 start_codon:yes stop_codon:yes gene_type:complete